MTDETQPEGFIQRWRKFVVATLEVSGVLALACSIVSITMNTILFAGWNLYFLDIATPTDVFMSGILLSTSMIVGVLGALVAFLITKTLDKSLRKIFGRRSGIARIAVVLALLLAIAWLCRSEESTSLFELVVYLGLFVAAVATVLPERRLLGLRAVTLAAILAICTACVLQVLALQQQARDDATGLFITNRTEACPSTLLALWVGDKSIVAACGALDESNVVVIPRDGTILVDRTNYLGVERMKQPDGVIDFPLTPADWYSIPNFGEVSAAVYANVGSVHREGRLTKMSLVRVYDRPTNDGIYFSRADLAVDCKTQASSWMGSVQLDRSGMIITDPRSLADKAKIASWVPDRAAVQLACGFLPYDSKPISGSILANATQVLKRPRDDNNPYWRQKRAAEEMAPGEKQPVRPSYR